uniref:Uncharacterized protein n=1 Tax=Anguilla anguilla TaxID=7936 RepID=A0A0E9WCE1_ANGAN
MWSVSTRRTINIIMTYIFLQQIELKTQFYCLDTFLICLNSPTGLQLLCMLPGSICNKTLFFFPSNLFMVAQMSP